MFKDNFNKEMQKIKVTDKRKAEFLETLENEQKKAKPIKFKPSAKKRWVAAIAASLAIVIVAVSMFNLPIFSVDNHTETGSPGVEIGSNEVENDIEFPTFEHTKGIPANASYSQIFKLFSAIYKSEQKKYSQYATGTDDRYVLEDAEEYVIDEGAIEESYDYEDTGSVEDTGSMKGENATATPDSSSEDYSTTNTQVEDVDEADVVKTDGKYIYTLNVKDAKINITKAEKGKLTEISTINLSDNSQGREKYFYGSDMYLANDRLVVIHQYYSGKDYTNIKIYDVSNPENPLIVREVAQSGGYLSSRVIDGKVYLFTNEYIYKNPIESDKCSYVPCTSIDGDAPTPVEENNIYIFDGEVNRSYLTAVSVDIADGRIVDSKTALGGGSQLYANTKSIYVTAEESSYSYARAAGTPELVTRYENASRIMRFAINSGKITAVAEGVVKGTPLNQFSMDEHNNHFRIVTTKYDTYTTTNAVYILDDELNQVGAIEDIAKDERVYSVRFMGDTGYFVTFRETDPLFAVDLKDPKNPKILSALKIPGFSNYLHPWSNGLLLGIGSDADEKTGATGGVKLSMFDISDPTNVIEKHKEIASVWDSSVGTNHKGILVDYKKNFIGFASERGNGYYLYGYDHEKGFELKTVFDTVVTDDSFAYYAYNGRNVRGIYIGEYFYVCNYNGINSYKLSDFSKVDSIIF